jgi:hypothetical protein
MDATTFALKRQRQAFVGRIAQADSYILGAYAVTVVVTSREEGAAQPTVSTYSFTAWGDRLRELADESQRSIALGHLENAVKAVTQNAENLRAAFAAPTKGEADGGDRQPPLEPES